MITGDSSAHAYYHADGNGNVTALIATNQAVVARYLYDPYGNPLAATGPLAEANLYRFSSKEWHPSSGLVYYGGSSTLVVGNGYSKGLAESCSAGLRQPRRAV